MIPYQVFYNQKHKVDNFKTFGCICYLYVPKEKWTKLQSKSIKCFFLGYNDHSKVYRVFESYSRKIHLTRDVVFDEGQIGYHLIYSLPTRPISFPDFEIDTLLEEFSDDFDCTLHFPDPTEQDHTKPPSIPSNLPSIPPTPLTIPTIPSSIPVTNDPPVQRYPRHDRQPNQKFRDHYLLLTENSPQNTGFIIEPQNFLAAIQHPRWVETIQKEVDSISSNNTWTIVDHISNFKVLKKQSFSIYFPLTRSFMQILFHFFEKLVRQI
jgi:hypothetical protein